MVVVVVVVVGGGGVVVVVVVVVGGGGRVSVVTTGGALVGGVTPPPTGLVSTGAGIGGKVKGRVTKDGRALATGFPLAAMTTGRKGNNNGGLDLAGVEVGVPPTGVVVGGTGPAAKGRLFCRGEVVAVAAEELVPELFPTRRMALTAATITTPAMIIDQRQKVSSPLVLLGHWLLLLPPLGNPTGVHRRHHPRVRVHVAPRARTAPITGPFLGPANRRCHLQPTDRQDGRLN